MSRKSPENWVVERYDMAQEMRVLLCALITAHKRKDNTAFFATVDIAKKTLSEYANFSDEDWAVFRGDSPRRGRAAS